MLCSAHSAALRRAQQSPLPRLTSRGACILPRAHVLPAGAPCEPSPSVAPACFPRAPVLAAASVRTLVSAAPPLLLLSAACWAAEAGVGAALWVGLSAAGVAPEGGASLAAALAAVAAGVGLGAWAKAAAYRVLHDASRRLAGGARARAPRGRLSAFSAARAGLSGCASPSTVLLVDLRRLLSLLWSAALTFPVPLLAVPALLDGSLAHAAAAAAAAEHAEGAGRAGGSPAAGGVHPPAQPAPPRYTPASRAGGAVRASCEMAARRRARLLATGALLFAPLCAAALLGGAAAAAAAPGLMAALAPRGAAAADGAAAVAHFVSGAAVAAVMEGDGPDAERRVLSLLLFAAAVARWVGTGLLRACACEGAAAALAAGPALVPPPGPVARAAEAGRASVGAAIGSVAGAARSWFNGAKARAANFFGARGTRR